MTQRVPPYSNRTDWPRLVAEAVNALLTANETKTGQINALLTVTDWSALADYADDTAAASGGVGIGELYLTSGVIKVRVA